MSNIEPKGPYIYQPYGMQDEAHWASERIYAISGMDSNLMEIKGLKKREAELILDLINQKGIGFKCSKECDYYKEALKEFDLEDRPSQ